MMKVKRSNSWSYEDFSFEDYKFAEDTDPKERAAEAERKDHENFCRYRKIPKYSDTWKLL